MHQCMVKLQVLKRKIPEDQAMNQGIEDLEGLQSELTKAIEELSDADEDVGIVRALVRMKGLPLKFGSNQVFGLVVASGSGSCVSTVLSGNSDHSERLV